MSVVGSVSSKYYSGFNPLDIGDCALWLDAADTSTLTLSGSSVTQWRDKSGNGYNFTQSDSSKYPVYNGSGGGISFTGNGLSTGTTTQFLDNTSIPISNSAFSIFAVARGNASQPSINGYNYLIKGNLTSDGFLFMGNHSSKNFATFTGTATWNDINSNTPAVATANNTLIMGMIVSGSTLTPYYNGNVMTTKTGTTGSFSGIRIGDAQNGFPGYTWNGIVYEILIYNIALSGAQRQQIEGYLARKWGLLGGGGVQSITTFIPTSISGCGLWLDATDSSTLTFQSGNNVSVWTDKTTGIQAQYSTAAGSVNYPVSGSNINGKNAIFFNQSSLLATTTQSVTTRSYFAVLRIISPNTNPDANILWPGTTVGGFARGGSINVNSTNIIFANQNVANLLNLAYTVGSPLILSITFNNGTVGMWNTGGGTTTSTGQSSSRLGFSGSTDNVIYIGGVGGVYTTSGFLLGELLEYNSALSTTDRQNIEGYLARKWGLTGSLPSTHPYALRGLPSTHPYYSIAPVTRAFAPIDIPGCALWLDAADRSTLTLSGSSVTAWRDKSSNNYSSTVFNSPTYSTNSLNGFPGITFNGTSQYMDFGNVLNIGTSSIYVFVISKFDSTANAGIIGKTSARGGVTGRWALYRFASDGGLGYLFDNSNGSTSGFVADSSTEPRLLTLYWDRSNSFLFQNGSQIITRTFAYTSNFTGTDPLYVAAYPNSTGTGPQAGLYYPGKIGEILVYLGSLTTIQRQQVEAYLARKWGLIGGGMQTISTFNPTNVAGCALWLDAADSNSFTFSSGFNISQWRDKSPNNYTGTANGTPTLTENIQNGLPVVTFNGSTQYFDFGNVNNIGTNQLNIFTVAKFNTTGNGTIIAKSLAGGALGRYSLLRENSVLIPLIQGGSLGSAQGSGVSDTSTATRILGMVWDRTNDYIFINGTQSFVTTFIDSTNLNNTYNLLIGAYNNTTGTTPPTSGLYLNGYIMEIMVYLGTVTATQRQQIEGYLALKWGLQSSLPSTHPYALRGLPSTHPYVYRMPATTAFNPRQISGCALWLDAADPSTLTLSGTSVTAWRDKSSNNYSSTVYNSPTYSSSSLNGLPGITFNGSSQYISFGNIINLGTSPIYVFSVVKYDTTGDGTIIAKSSYRINSARWFLLRAAVDGGAIMGVDIGSGGATAAFADTTTNVQLFSGFWDRSTVYVFQNGTQRSSTAAVNSSSLTNTDPLYIAAYPNSTGTAPNTTGGYTYLNGKIGEILVYNESITTAQRQQVEGYLAWKWGLNGGYSPSIAPFTPTSVSGCQLWLDAADSSTLTLSGSSVTQWNDKSGNGRNATGVNNPTYNSTTNGINFVRTSSQYMTLPDGTLPFNDSSYSYFFIFTPASTVAGQTLIFGGGASVLRDSFGLRTGDAGTGTLQTYWIGYDLQTSTTYNLNVRNFAATYYTSGGSRSVWINFTQGASDTPGVSRIQTAFNNRIGRLGNFSDYLNAQIHEIIVYNTALSTTNRQNIEGYLANKWGLTGSLPSSHPYANRSLPTTHPYKVIKP